MGTTTNPPHLTSAPVTIRISTAASKLGERDKKQSKPNEMETVLAPANAAWFELPLGDASLSL